MTNHAPTAQILRNHISQVEKKAKKTYTLHVRVRNEVHTFITGTSLNLNSTFRCTTGTGTTSGITLDACTSRFHSLPNNQIILSPGKSTGWLGITMSRFTPSRVTELHPPRGLPASGGVKGPGKWYLAFDCFLNYFNCQCSHCNQWQCPLHLKVVKTIHDGNRQYVQKQQPCLGHQ